MCLMLFIAAVVLFFLGGATGIALLALLSVVALLFSFLALVNLGSFTDFPR